MSQRKIEAKQHLAGLKLPLFHKKGCANNQKMDIMLNNTLQRIFGRVHLVTLPQIPVDCPDSSYAYFGIDDSVVDSSKLRMPCTLLDFHRFFHIIDDQVLKKSSRSNVLCAEESAESQTAAALLLGAYMIMRLDMRPAHVMWRLNTAVGIQCRAGLATQCPHHMLVAERLRIPTGTIVATV